MNLALVTYAAHPALQPDDALLADALRRAGATAVPAVWNDPAVRWDAYDGIVLRSTWDYFLVPAEFSAWLAQRERGPVPLVNPPAVVRWNADKCYLRELAARGVGIVPTRFVEPGDGAATLAEILEAEGWDAAVAKPAVSAGSHETWRTSRAAAAGDQARFATLVMDAAVLVQPFVREIEEDGEWSLLFFAGAFSHAVRKRPARGDFRVQEQFGGVSLAEAPPAGAVEAAGRAIAEAAAVCGVDPAELAYARVDGCMVQGAFALMELELIEPSLFFTQHPPAAEHCAQAILRALEPGRNGAPRGRDAAG